MAHRDACLSLAMYLRETLAEDATRRFAMGFTICGSLMRVWVFDRIGSSPAGLSMRGEEVVAPLESRQPQYKSDFLSRALSDDFPTVVHSASTLESTDSGNS
ncbi:hypothetical protein E4U32_000273 [Claviceps aff. humidiphila group G2b]|nr:hypothetical protein E4U32_000273 [Claviceps aff. humidiphila group G2b]